MEGLLLPFMIPISDFHRYLKLLEINLARKQDKTPSINLFAQISLAWELEFEESAWQRTIMIGKTAQQV